MEASQAGKEERDRGETKNSKTFSYFNFFFAVTRETAAGNECPGRSKRPARSFREQRSLLTSRYQALF